MCLLIVSKGEPIPRGLVAKYAVSNPDGFGFAYYSKKQRKMIIYNSMSLDDLLKQMKSIPAVVHMLHLRYGTQGERSVYNCHPFRVNKQMCFAHNGHVHGLGDQKKSDSLAVADLL